VLEKDTLYTTAVFHPYKIELAWNGKEWAGQGWTGQEWDGEGWHGMEWIG
jgi:hypothetical protein